VSAKRTVVLKKYIGHHLTGLCETRWIERHEGTTRFLQDMPKIINTLTEITTRTDIMKVVVGYFLYHHALTVSNLVGYILIRCASKS